MSSTKRGGKRSEADWYGTPPYCVYRLLEALKLPGGEWLEPAVGDGAIVRAVAKVRSDVTWAGLDIRKTAFIKKSGGKFAVGNFLKPATYPDGFLYEGAKRPVCITNPPFSLAMPFIETAFEHAEQVVMLLRLNFIGSEKRADFMRTNTPDIYTLPNRPPFRGDGKTDSIEYGWFVWNEPRARPHGLIRVLNSTSKVERL